MTEEDGEQYRNINICRFLQKNIEADKVIDHCHFTVKNRGAAHSRCNIIVTEKQSNSIPFVFQIFSNFHCLFFKKVS